MRPLLLLLAAGISVSAAPPPAGGSMMPGYEEPARQWRTIDDAKAALSCRDKVEQVRETGDQPKLDREPASAGKPLMIAAVDKRIDGCAVMQMKGNINDVRPIPKAPDHAPLLQPAR